jgi:integrase/recombinase XerC
MIAIRNQAIEQLYFKEGVNRSRISELNIGDVDLRHNRIRYRPFRQKKKIWHNINSETKRKIKNWIDISPLKQSDDPLFVALDSCQYGHRLSVTSINRNVVART